MDGMGPWLEPTSDSEGWLRLLHHLLWLQLRTFQVHQPGGGSGWKIGIQKKVQSASPSSLVAQDEQVSAQRGTCLINHPLWRSTAVGGRMIHTHVDILKALPPKFQSYWRLQSMAAKERYKSKPWGLTWRHTAGTLKSRGRNYRSCIWGVITLSILLQVNVGWVV